jgi:hypothetical protein
MKSRILRAIAAGLFVGALLVAGAAPYGLPGKNIVVTSSDGN